MNKKIIISNLSLIFGEKNKILSNISLNIQDSEINCILGPSGCGKTTLLRAIAGFEDVSSGSILKDGICITNSVENMPVANRNMGMVFQDYALFPNMDVKTNIEFGLKNHSDLEKENRVNYLLDLVNLPECKNKFPHELSGGEQQRIALIRALAPSPDIILMDEPFSNIDQDIKEELVSDVRDLLKELSITSIIVTHDQNEAFNIADQVAIMNKGVIQQIGTPYDIYHKPANKFVAGFIGLGTFLPVRKVSDNGFEIPLGLLNNERIKNDLTKFKNLEMLIRPDDIIHNDSSPKKAVILEKQFRGAEFLYKLLYNNEYSILCYAPSHHNHAIGDSIGIELDIKHYVIFER
ncbi:MAG: ABC transporter ATP-binding protein [Euryarchaeota archaeon]|nr:ABC transporter ATP-binding protein [Euryarchaeota archaeon]|tara:strand:+ start:2674 stop:3723 length:1050 start_codon:yes stop_codon:yes gene_type:complete